MAHTPPARLVDTAHADASVVICAYTEARWDELRAAVESLRHQTCAPREILLVIDHNDQLLRRARAGIPDAIALENQEARGLSGARNTGVRAAHSAFIAFLDDDAVADPEWLAQLMDACADPRTLGCGGLVEPDWRAGKPAWFPDEFGWVVGCSYTGLPLQRNAVRNMIGASMLIRREVFDTIGGFRAEVGRVGKHPVGCEETELCLRALRHWPGRMFVYEPAARIHHLVPGDRGRWSYFRDRCFYEGRSKALVAQLAGARDGLSSERSYTLRTLPTGVARNSVETLTRRDPWGLARAAAIIAGLAITTAGYASGVLLAALARREDASRPASAASTLATQTAASFANQTPPVKG